MPFAEETKLLKNPAPALRHDSICSTIGSTPLVKLQRSAPPGVNIYVKSEFMNPMGSVKDRLALGMIEFAEQHGLLKPGQTVVEAGGGRSARAFAEKAAECWTDLCMLVDKRKPNSRQARAPTH